MNETPDTFTAYLVEKGDDGRVAARVTQLPLSSLPEGDVLIRVAYSSLNYKDALSATGHPGVTKRFPHVPGIDAAGTIAHSDSPQWQVGQQVLVTGFDMGATRWGGFAQFVRVPAEWVVPLPQNLSLRESMILGTAGLTAGMSVATIAEHKVGASAGEVVVTGASGGVGSLSVCILAKLGYRVTAISGKPDSLKVLKRLGAQQVQARDVVDDTTGKPLLPARWSGGVDTVGGNVLATILKSTQPTGCVAACGVVGGAELHFTVHPFILRGVHLAGIDSAHCPVARRSEIWSLLAGEWKLDRLDELTTEIGLAELDHWIPEILAGRVTGRVVVAAPS